MDVEIVPLPSMLEPRHLVGRCVVVFDTLRASTTIAAALAAGAREVRVFETVEEARAAAAEFGDGALLAGERGCVRIEGFELGNSPREMTAAAVSAKVIFMTTTNGTRAIAAARDAAEVLVASLVNAGATAAWLKKQGRAVTCLCAGTGGRRAPEDELAAEHLGGLLSSARPFQPMSPEEVFRLLAETEGGRNIAAAGLGKDIEFAAHADCLNVVCRRSAGTNILRRVD